MKKQIKKMSAFDPDVTIYFCLEDFSDISPQKLLNIFMDLDSSWLELHGCKINTFTHIHTYLRDLLSMMAFTSSLIPYIKSENCLLEISPSRSVSIHERLGLIP